LAALHCNPLEPRQVVAAYLPRYFKLAFYLVTVCLSSFMFLATQIPVDLGPGTA